MTHVYEVERKLFAIGKKYPTYCVSIPKDWVKASKLKQGDKVIVKYNGVVTIVSKNELIERATYEIEGIDIRIEPRTVIFRCGNLSKTIHINKIQFVLEKYGRTQCLEALGNSLKKSSFPDIPQEKLESVVMEALKNIII